jgi:hypothetical protein
MKLWIVYVLKRFPVNPDGWRPWPVRETWAITTSEKLAQEFIRDTATVVTLRYRSVCQRGCEPGVWRA